MAAEFQLIVMTKHVLVQVALVVGASVGADEGTFVGAFVGVFDGAVVSGHQRTFFFYIPLACLFCLPCGTCLYDRASNCGD